MSIPERLYRYQRVTDHTLDNLSRRVIWFSAPASFNDPFDCALQLWRPDRRDPHCAMSDVSSRRQIGPTLEATAPTDEPARRALMAALSCGVAAALDDIVEHNRQNRGAVCLSAIPTDILMWSHYADGHRGFCLEFDTSKHPFDRARQVRYTDEVPTVDPLDAADLGSMADILELMMLTKAECWSYEHEWRLVHGVAGTAYCFEPSALTAVYLGSATSSDDEARIIRALDGLSVSLYRMVHNYRSFSISPEKIEL